MTSEREQSLSFSKENDIVWIQTAFEIMGLNEHTKVMELLKTGIYGTRTKYQNVKANKGNCITKQ